MRVFLELYVKALNSILPFEPQSLEYRLLTEEDMKKMMDGVMLDAVTNGGRDLIYQVFDKCLVAFFESNSFEEAIRNAVSLGGDTDTIGAITGSIAEAYYGIPNELKEKALEKLPDDFVLKLDEGYQKVKKL